MAMIEHCDRHNSDTWRQNDIKAAKSNSAEIISEIY